MAFSAHVGHDAAVRCAGLLMFLVLLASSSVVGGAAVGRLTCDPVWAMDMTNKRPTASRCALVIDAAEDLYDMASFTFAGQSAANEELSLVYTKTKSTKRFLDNGGMDTIWEGSDDGFGTATLIHDGNGGLAGSFSTSTSVFTVLPSGKADGLLRIQENYWVNALDSGSDDAEDYAAGSGSGRNDDGASVLTSAATIVVNPQPTQGSITSWGDATVVQSPVEDGNHNRMLRTDRHLQITSVVDVLLVVTNRALCESANLPLGCTSTATNRAPLESLLGVAQQQINQGMQIVGVPVEIRFVSVIYLEPGFDGRVTQDTLDQLKADGGVAQWRRDANADLVALISGEDPNGRAGGLAYLNDFVSVTSHREIPYYALNHELFHNFGCRHDRANSGNNLHPYGHGLQVPGYFRTVMAYDCPNRNCPLLFVLSASGYTYTGIPLGDATHDNARLVRENAATIAAFSQDLTTEEFWCFSERSEVVVEGKGVTSMDALKIGDSVLTAKGTVSKVYSFGHRDKAFKTKYLQIFAASMHKDHPLEISPEHLIYTQGASKNRPMLVAADDLRVGDNLLNANGRPLTILWIREVERKGAYAPLTVSGNLLVNGVLASSYVSRCWLKDHVSGLTLHQFQHGAMLPVRFFCSLVGCQTERYDKSTGFSAWVQFWYEIEQWMLTLPWAWRACFWSLLLVPATLIVFLGIVSVQPLSSLITHAVAVIVGCIIWKRQTCKSTVPIKEIAEKSS